MSRFGSGWWLKGRFSPAITQAGAGGGAAPAFTPDAAFFAGAQGYAYDPYDYSTMFQDSAGATPVTAASQTLGKINDLSGNGNHRTQATSGKRPLTTADGFYVFDGTDDAMSATVNTSAAGAWTYIARVGRGADAVGMLLFGFGANAYFGTYDGTAASATGTGTTSPTYKVDGAVVANTRVAMQTALGGAPHVVQVNASLTHATWNNLVKIGDYAAFISALTVGREILIQRTLTGDELANALAWVSEDFF